MKRILAIDYGLKRTGLAVTDSLQLIAGSLATVETHTLQSYLKEYISREPVGVFVVGKPVTLKGRDTHSTKAVEKFVLLLSQWFPEIEIVSIDERLTSRMAKQALVEMGLKKKDRQDKGNIDQVSAVLILQTYLDMRSFR